MSRIRIILFVFLVLGCANIVDSRPGRDQNQNTAAMDLLSKIKPETHPPVFFVSSFPIGDKYILRENEGYILGVVATSCHGNTDTPPSFELLSPAPDFIQLAPSGCQSNGQSMALVGAFPKKGDAGTYQVRIKANAGCGIDSILLTVKVKKARDE